MDRMKYLMKRYETDDLEVLKCRVPFNYEDCKYNNLTDDEYIHMIDQIENEEDESIYSMLKDRGFVK